MPFYKGQVVSDEFLQAMVASYRTGYDAVLGEGSADTSDEVVIARLESQSAEQIGAETLGRADAAGAE